MTRKPEEFLRFLRTPLQLSSLGPDDAAGFRRRGALFTAMRETPQVISATGK